MELIEAADALTKDMRSKVGESLKRVNNAPGLLFATTSSLEALRWYSRARLASDRDGDFQKAVEFHQRAVAADSTFAEAWRTLASMLNNVGAPRSTIDSAFVRAYRFRGRLPEPVQNRIAGDYFSFGPGRDRAKAIAIYQKMLANGDSGWSNNIAIAYFTRRDYATVEALLTPYVQRSPRFVQGRDGLVQTFVQQGQLATAESTVAAGFGAVAVAPIQWRLDATSVSYARGDLAAASASVDSLRRDSTLGAGASRAVDLMAGGLAAVQGRVTMARHLQEAASSAASRSAAGSLPLLDSLAAGRLDLILGNRTSAVTHVDAAVNAGELANADPSDRPYLAVAQFYAMAGRVDRARGMLQERTAQLRDTSILRAEAPFVYAVQAQISLAEGKGRDAIREFWRSDSAPDGPSNPCLRCLYANLARAWDAVGEPDSTIDYLNQYLATPDFLAASGSPDTYTPTWYAPDPLYLAPAHERLGQLYEAKGDLAKAAEQYQAFIDLWKNADPGLQPRVAEARRRLARIAATEKVK
jgi:tetratricopeptide (TPR) repeat protein